MRLQEGGLIEVFLFPSLYEDWLAVFDVLIESDYLVTLKRRGIVVAPSISREMFTDGEAIDFLLEVVVGRQLWTSHLYSASLVDFQGDPREVTLSSDIDDLVGFMQVVADAVCRPVKLVSETLNYEDAVAWITINPT
jgi:hypothetical protein